MDQERLGELLSAYLDGQLEPAQTESVERLVAKDPQAQRLLKELRLTTECVSKLPRHGAPNSVLEDIQLRLERAELLDGPQTTSGGAHSRRSGLWQWMSIAAVVGIAVMGGTWAIFGGRGSPGGVGEGIVVQAPRREKSTAPDEFTPAVSEDRLEENALGTARTQATRPTAGRKGGANVEAALDTSSKTKLESEAILALRDRAKEPAAVATSSGHPPTSVSYRTMDGANLKEGQAGARLHLKLTAADEAGRQRVLAGLTSTLRAYLVEPKDVGGYESGAGESATPARTRRIPVGGSAEDSAAPTMLVRIPAAHVDAVVAALGTQFDDEYVTFSAGAEVFEGWKRTRGALDRISASADNRGSAARPAEPQPARSRTDTRTPETEFAARPSAEAESHERESWLDQALDAAGLDRDGIARNLPGLAEAGGQVPPVDAKRDEAKTAETTGRTGSIAQSRQAGAPAESESTVAATPTDEDRLAKAPRSSMPAGATGESNERLRQEEPRLVERRMQALRAKEAAPPVAGATLEAPAAARTGDARTNVDRYVTLVIEVDVRKPTPPRARNAAPRSSRTLRKPPPADKPK